MTDQPGNPDGYAYYDRDVDIVWIPTGQSGDFFADEQPWGAIMRYRADRAVAAIEIWSASERLPKEILDALPEPGNPDA